MHSTRGEKKECGQEVIVQMEWALWHPAVSDERMTVSEIAVEPGKKRV